MRSPDTLDALDGLVRLSNRVGQDLALVQPGGGNSSIKVEVPDSTGNPIRTLLVKGSGTDMRTIGRAGFSQLSLERLGALRGVERMSDREMMRFMADCATGDGPAPSVETPLHSILPHRVIVHTHDVLTMSLTNLREELARRLVEEVFEGQVVYVPYARPGFPLARLVGFVGLLDVALAVARRPVEERREDGVQDERGEDPGEEVGQGDHHRSVDHQRGVEPTVTPDGAQLGGLASLKRWLEVRREAFLGHGDDSPLPAPKGMLLLGVQGASKSLAAKCVAGAWQLPLFRLDFGSLYNKFHGESERNIREALAVANAMAPCVLWMDEIEKGVAADSGGDADGGVSRRVLGTLITWMSERTARVFLVATANDISQLPPELLRKGRFDEVFFVDLPGSAAREDILRIHLQRNKQDPAAFDLARLAGACEGFSGAEIEHAILAAHTCAICRSTNVTGPARRRRPQKIAAHAPSPAVHRTT